MTQETLLVEKNNLSAVHRVSNEQQLRIHDGQVLVEVALFGLSANNISYASVGESLGYWAYFPAEDGKGCVPVWAFATVVESQCDDVRVGERIFGYFPMSSHLVLTPSDASDLCFTDATDHRSDLLPWYNRYYRCAGDPVYSETQSATQVVLWALFMTGWMMADELTGKVQGVVVSSASSKTALSLAWSLKHLDASTRVIGLTSKSNENFVNSLGTYDSVVAYDELSQIDKSGLWAYVDIAGNAEVTSKTHVHFGDALVDSVMIGSTHRAASDQPLPMPGPSPRFFFIPTVAEARAAADTHAAYHAAFATAWKSFADWTEGWLEVEQQSGLEAIETGYRNALEGGLPPQVAKVFTWK